LTRPDGKGGDGIEPIIGFGVNHPNEAASVVGAFTDESEWNLTWNRSPVFSVKGRFDILRLEAMVSDLFQVS
jgi:hypothetical protein